MEISEFENLESKLNDLMKTCLEIDQLSVELHDLEPGSRAYELVLRKLETDGQALKSQAGAIEQVIAGINGQKVVGA